MSSVTQIKYRKSQYFHSARRTTITKSDINYIIKSSNFKKTSSIMGCGFYKSKQN